MKLTGLRVSANEIRVKYVYDTAIPNVVYKGIPDAFIVTARGVQYAILDTDRLNWEWDIEIPYGVTIPSDLTIDGYNFNTVTNQFSINTSVVSGEIYNYTKPIQIEVPSGTALNIKKGGLVVGGGFLNVSGATAIGGSLTCNNSVNLQTNIEASDFNLASGALVVGFISSTSGKAGMSVVGTANIGKNCNVYGALNVRGIFSLEGQATFKNNLVIEGNLSVLNEATINALSVSDDALFSKNITVEDNITGDTFTCDSAIRLLRTVGDILIQKNDTGVLFSIDGLSASNGLSIVSKQNPVSLLYDRQDPSDILNDTIIYSNVVKVNDNLAMSTKLSAAGDWTDTLKKVTITLDIIDSTSFNLKNILTLNDTLLNLNTNIDVNGSTKLKDLDVNGSTKLKDLDVNGPTKLKDLEVTGTALIPSLVINDETLADNSITSAPSQRAIKDYVDSTRDIINSNFKDITLGSNVGADLYELSINSSYIYSKEQNGYIQIPPYLCDLQTEIVLATEEPEDPEELLKLGVMYPGTSLTNDAEYGVYIIRNIAIPSIQQVVVFDKSIGTFYIEGWEIYTYLFTIFTDSTGVPIKGIWERRAQINSFTFLQTILVADAVTVPDTAGIQVISKAPKDVLTTIEGYIELGEADSGYLGIATAGHNTNLGVPIKGVSYAFKETILNKELKIVRSGSYSVDGTKTSIYIKRYTEFF